MFTVWFDVRKVRYLRGDNRGVPIIIQMGSDSIAGTATTPNAENPMNKGFQESEQKKYRQKYRLIGHAGNNGGGSVALI